MAEIHSPIARFTGPAAAVAALALAAGVLTACGDAGAAITRLTVGTPGPDPYTLVSGTDETDVKERPKAGGTQTGDSPGLYGGTRQEATCDPQKLIAFLQANPGKARAWAGVQGIPVSDVPRYVSRLTPVLLRTDTLVTNHGYRNGKATSGPAVLQAGMGVLVNGYGVPVVKCNCGNPLTRPDKKISPDGASYTGRSWPGFEKRNVTEIEPRDSKKGTITTFVLVDPEGTMGFERPRATEGEADGPPAELPATETELTDSESPSPYDSGLESPGTESPGTGTPGTEPTGTESPGTPSPGTGEGGGDSPASTGVTSHDPGMGGGDPTGSGTGEESRAPISLPPSEEPAPPVG
ncbi:DUF6777 domain-containing protein [Actinomadura livida]|uniref:DUF6777 domain-containing protein n=1 Tax=Actinomadura livida TaxID=79909 RepID=A0A7W7MY03_9ACTN|nr:MULTISPECIES: DUF6777 domain-containing protein [Actinomadura]MBB4774337.1 hypothetical protein [Actinomadura catellatispora]GGT83299.1 hypothetical protein GCM10010208_02120 [Actinomadura livida]